MEAAGPESVDYPFLTVVTHNAIIYNLTLSALLT